MDTKYNSGAEMVLFWIREVTLEQKTKWMDLRAGKVIHVLVID